MLSPRRGSDSHSPGQSEAAQPPSRTWVSGRPHVRCPEGARQMRNKRVKNSRNRASKTSKCQRHAAHGRFVGIRFSRRSPRIEPIHSQPFRNDREHIRFAVLSCPFGAMDLRGPCYPGRRSAGCARVALPWAKLSLPLRGVRTVGTRRPGTEGTDGKKRCQDSFWAFRVGGGSTGGSAAARLPVPNSHLQRESPG
jgi:hypothetical protein